MMSANGVLNWLREELDDYKSIKIENLTSSFQDGMVKKKKNVKKKKI